MKGYSDKAASGPGDVVALAPPPNVEANVKLSARNQLKGTVKSVTKGQTTAHVEIDVGGIVLTASITNEAVDSLGLMVGLSAYAVVKASDVLIGVD
jgi:molybdopterin-binding protein